MKANLIIISRCPKNTRGYIEERKERGENVEYDINKDGNFNGEYNYWYMSINSWENRCTPVPDMDYLDYIPETTYDPESNYRNGRWVTFKDLFHTYQKVKGSDQNIPFSLAFDMVNRRVIELYNMEVSCVLVGDEAKILFDMLKNMPSVGWAIVD